MQHADRAAEILADAGVTGPADPLPDEPKTELGYARRLVHVYGHHLRYVPAWRRWLVWDGKRWANDSTGQAQRWMKSIARRITADATADWEATRDDKKYQAAMSLARRAESSAGVTGALTLAGTEKEAVVTPGDLDPDPYLLNCQNGTLDLRTGELRDHDPADLITKLAVGAYDPAASGRTFGEFLARVQPDEDMRGYLGRLVGHGLVGQVVEHLLQIHCGEGANGKSTFITAITAALGDYAGPAEAELLTARTFDAHPTGVADLFGLRLAILHEADKGRRLAEGTVKRLTGGDRIKARRMREDFWEFEPSHSFVMLTNHKPVVTGTDEGIWRRIRLIPWDIVIPVEERDEHLGDKLALELDYVLTWLVQGCLTWREHGLGDPAAVAQATSAYRAESDALGRFLAQCTMNYGRVKSSELFAAWSKWCADEGEDPGTQTKFSTDLVNRGYDKKRTETGAFWQGLGLTNE
jgi:putative DNA primase/helicase